MSNKCIPIYESGTIEQANELNRIAKKWFQSPKVKAMTGGRTADFHRFYNQKLPHLDYKLSRLPNAKELKKLDRELNKFLKDVNKDLTKWASLWKLPEVIFKKFPTGDKYFKNMVNSSNYYRGNLQLINSDLKTIKTNLNIAAGETGILNKYGRGRSNAQKQLQDLYTEYKRRAQNEGHEAATRFYEKNLSDKVLRESNDQLQAMQRLWELMIDPSLMRKQSKLSPEYGPALIEAANIWHYGDKTTKKPALKEELWKILGSGLKDNIDVLKSLATRYNGMEPQVKRFEQLYNDYFRVTKDKNGKSVPPPKKPDNYFPRQVIDIAPTFARLSDDIHSGFADKNPEVVGKYLDRMMENVKDNLSVTGNVFERSPNAPNRTSKDVLDILDTYAHNTVRFNYNARVSKDTITALKDLHRAENIEFDKNLQSLSSYIQETHDAAIGLNYRNNKFANIARSLTGWQFISKLGFNARTVARNATQSLQNWVYFGGKTIIKSMSDMKDDKYKQILTKEMTRHGYEFVNIQEIAMPRDLMNNLKIDDTGLVTQHAPGTITKFNSWLESIADISGKPMQWVENHVNRGLTFKIAFMERYDALKNNQVSLKKRLDRKKFESEEKFSAALEKQRIRQSSDYAAEMVKELHYLYDPWAKPGITRSPLGSVLGQFSTYSINFFEYQRKIAAQGTNAVIAKEWNSPEAWRMYRLGMLYTAVTGIGAVTNSKWSNLVQNDTFDRLKRLDDYLTGTKEEKESAFFGRDPITATFGGPTVSDIMKLGSLINFQRMSGHDLRSYLELYEGAAKRSKYDLTEEIVRMLNTQGHRLIYQTGPRMVNGTGFPTIVGQELGLYNTPELNQLRDKMLYPLQKYLPEPVSTYLTPDKNSKSSKLRKKSSTDRFSNQEIDDIMNVLNTIRQSE